jgi:hypothetical protein
MGRHGARERAESSTSRFTGSRKRETGFGRKKLGLAERERLGLAERERLGLAWAFKTPMPTLRNILSPIRPHLLQQYVYLLIPLKYCYSLMTKKSSI